MAHPKVAVYTYVFLVLGALFTISFAEEASVTGYAVANALQAATQVDALYASITIFLFLLTLAFFLFILRSHQEANNVHPSKTKKYVIGIMLAVVVAFSIAAVVLVEDKGATGFATGCINKEVNGYPVCAIVDIASLTVKPNEIPGFEFMRMDQDDVVPVDDHAGRGETKFWHLPFHGFPSAIHAHKREDVSFVSQKGSNTVTQYEPSGKITNFIITQDSSTVIDDHDDHGFDHPEDGISLAKHREEAEEKETQEETEQPQESAETQDKGDNPTVLAPAANDDGTADDEVTEEGGEDTDGEAVLEAAEAVKAGSEASAEAADQVEQDENTVHILQSVRQYREQKAARDISDISFSLMNMVLQDLAIGAISDYCEDQYDSSQAETSGDTRVGGNVVAPQAQNQCTGAQSRATAQATYLTDHYKVSWELTSCSGDSPYKIYLANSPTDSVEIANGVAHNGVPNAGGKNVPIATAYSSICIESSAVPGGYVCFDVVVV